MNSKIPSAQIMQTAKAWLINLLALIYMGILFLLPGLIYLPLVFTKSALVYSAIQITVALVIIYLALKNLVQGPTATVNVLKHCIPALTKKAGERLVEQWTLVMLLIAIGVDWTICLFAYAEPTALWLALLVLALALPVCGIITTVAIRQIHPSLPKRDLVLIPAIYLLAALPALVVVIPILYLLLFSLVQLNSQPYPFADPDLLTLPLLFALVLMPIFLFYGIGGAIGSVLLFLRLNRSYSGLPTAPVTEGSRMTPLF